MTPEPRNCIVEHPKLLGVKAVMLLSEAQTKTSPMIRAFNLG